MMTSLKKYLPLALLLFMLPLALQAQNKKPVYVKIYTNMGNMKVMLYDDTPLHRDNFIKLVNSHFYDKLLFHRVINHFMIQGGDPKSLNADSTVHLGDGGNGYTIPAEINFPQHYHKRGALCMARTGDETNPDRASSGCQFYIVYGKTYTDEQLDQVEADLNQNAKPNQPIRYNSEQRLQYKTFGGTPHLDGQYTVFGELVDGFDVLEHISNVPTNENDRPTTNVVILKMKVVKR